MLVDNKMKEILLQRIWFDDKYTLGILIDDYPICLTLELPWHDNKTDISCIPNGDYTVEYKDGKYHVYGVDGRKYIEMHSGNTVDDTHGCILFGESVGRLNNKFAVLESKSAMRKFRKLIGDNFKLIVV